MTLIPENILVVGYIECPLLSSDGGLLPLKSTRARRTDQTQIPVGIMSADKDVV